MFLFNFSWTFVNGTDVSVVGAVVVSVVVPDVVPAVVDAGVVVFLLPFTSAFADFEVAVFTGFAAFVVFVVDFTGLTAVDFTGFGGLLTVAFVETGFTFVVVGFTDFETDVCVGLVGFTVFGFGPP